MNRLVLSWAFGRLIWLAANGQIRTSQSTTMRCSAGTATVNYRQEVAIQTPISRRIHAPESQQSTYRDTQRDTVGLCRAYIS